VAWADIKKFEKVQPDFIVMKGVANILKVFMTPPLSISSCSRHPFVLSKISTSKCNSYPSLIPRKATVNALALTHNGQGALGMRTRNIGVGEQLGIGVVHVQYGSLSLLFSITFSAGSAC
jgi:hypothetical protein